MLDLLLNKLLIFSCFVFGALTVFSQGSTYVRISEGATTSPYTPTDVSGIWFWVDADDPNTIYKDAGNTLASYGDTVQQWNDKSGFNRHLTQDSVVQKPIYVNGAFNGRDVLDFDLNDWMKHNLATNYTNDFTLFIVLKSQNPLPGNYESFFSNTSDFTLNGSFQIHYNSPSEFQFRTNSNGSGFARSFGPFVHNTIKLFAVEFNKSTGEFSLFDNGNFTSQGINNDIFLEEIRVNINRNSNKHHDSQIAEIIIFDKVLSNCESLKLNSYLSSKYSVNFNFSPSPGGMGCDNNPLWLKPSYGTTATANGDTISQWEDASSSSHVFTQPNSINQPIYRDNLTDNINFNPVVEFGGQNKLLSSPSVLGSTNSEITIFVVSKEISRTSNIIMKFKSSFTNPDRYSIHIPWSSGIIYWDVGSTNTSNRIYTGTITPVNRPSLTTLTNSVSNGSQQIFQNGALYKWDYSGHIVNGLDSTYIGINFDGYIPEIIIFNTYLSIDDKNIIETYLGIKYGITLTNNYLSSNGDLIYDLSNGYSKGIVGVGKDIATDLNQKKSHSETDPTAGITIELTQSVATGVFLICGHNGGALTRINLAGESNVLTRKYFANETGGVGTINMELDLSAIGANTNLPASDVKIGISNFANFTNTHWIEATSVVNGIATFTGLPLHDKYFTFSAAQ